MLCAFFVFRDSSQCPRRARLNGFRLHSKFPCEFPCDASGASGSEPDSWRRPSAGETSASEPGGSERSSAAGSLLAWGIYLASGLIVRVAQCDPGQSPASDALGARIGHVLLHGLIDDLDELVLPHDAGTPWCALYDPRRE